MAKKFKTIKISEETYIKLKEISEKEMIKMIKIVDALVDGKIKIDGYDIIKNSRN